MDEGGQKMNDGKKTTEQGIQMYINFKTKKC